MATHGMSRLAVLFILGAMIAAPSGSVAESESPASPDGFGTSNYSRVPHDRATEPNGADLSVSALPGEETSSAPAGVGVGVGVGSCDVLVAAALEPEQYFPNNDFLSRLSILTQSNADYFDAVIATPTLEEPVGKTELRTFLYNEAGKAGGAYFTEVEAIQEE